MTGAPPLLTHMPCHRRAHALYLVTLPVFHPRLTPVPCHGRVPSLDSFIVGPPQTRAMGMRSRPLYLRIEGCQRAALAGDKPFL